MILQIKDANGNWVGIPAIQGTPGESGGEVKNYYIDNYMSLTEEDIALLNRILENDERDWCINTSVGFMTGIKRESSTKLSFYLFSHDISMYWSGYFSSTTNKITLSYVNTIATQGYVDAAISNAGGGGGGSWTCIDIGSHSDFYNCHEILIIFRNTNTDRYSCSYLVVPNNAILGHWSYNYVAIPTTDALDNSVGFWYYDGSGIWIENNDEYQFMWALIR